MASKNILGWQINELFSSFHGFIDKLDHPCQLGIVIVLWLRDISSVRPVPLPGSGESENAMRIQSMTSYTATPSTQGRKNILVRSIHLHMQIMKSNHKIKQLPLIKDLGIQNDN